MLMDLRKVRMDRKIFNKLRRGNWEDRKRILTWEDNIGISQRKVILERDSYKCQLCGRERGYLEIHHIKGKVWGGKNWPANLVSLCAVCHRIVPSNIKGFLKLKRYMKKK